MSRRFLPEFDKGAHSVYLLYYHLVIVTKYRAKLLDEDMILRIKSLADYVGERHGVKCEECNGEADHVHFLLCMKPTTDICQYIASLKALSARVLKQDFHVKVPCKKGSLWSPSYCLLTTGGAPIDVIRKYIENQGNQ